jgi:hypothetical protein
VSEDRVLRRIFGPEREEVGTDWRSLHNEKIHNLYASPNIIMVIEKKNEMGGACRMHGKDDKCVQYFRWKTRKKDTTWKT